LTGHLLVLAAIWNAYEILAEKPGLKGSIWIPYKESEFLDQLLTSRERLSTVGFVVHFQILSLIRDATLDFYSQ
jgi:hypothetical protein